MWYIMLKYIAKGLPQARPGSPLSSLWYASSEEDEQGKTPPASDKAAKFRTFPKTVSSANHDILSFLDSGSSSTAERNPLGPTIAMTSSRWRLLCPRCCHLLPPILSAFLQRLPRLPRLPFPCRQLLANHRRPSPLLQALHFADPARHHPTLPRLAVETATATLISLPTSRASRVIDTVRLPFFACFSGLAKAIGSSVQQTSSLATIGCLSFLACIFTKEAPFVAVLDQS